MVAMIVNRPLRDDDVWLFCFKELCVGIVMDIVDDGMTVFLVGIERLGFEDFASFSRLGDARFCRGGRPSSVVEIEQCDGMAEAGEAADGASAAVFRVTGMATGHDHF